MSSKKNGKRSFRGRVIIDPNVQREIRSHELVARAAWGGRAPLERAKISAVFYVRDGRGDLDGKWTTAQDVLVKAGVLRNDSIARLDHVILRAVVTNGDEAVEIRLYSDGEEMTQ